MKLRCAESNLDVFSLRILYHDFQAQVRSLESLGNTEENYGTLLALIIMELLPHELQLNINFHDGTRYHIKTSALICRANNGLRQERVNRNLDEMLCNLSRVLTIIKCEINAREKCTTAIEQERLRKNVSSSVEPLSAASLFSGQKSKLLCVFCKKLDWSDKCRTISDPSSRKQFLKQGGYCFLCLKEEHKIRDCKKEKVFFSARITQFRYLF